MNIFYSQVDPAVQLELDARGNSGKRRNTQDLNFMLGKVANVQLTAYKSGSADPGSIIKSDLAIIGGSTVRSGRYLPSGDGGFLTNPSYTVNSITYKDGQAALTGSSLTDTSRRIGPIITGVSVDIGDHSMGLLNKATINITIPNPTRDLDGVEEIWFYPGRYVKIDIEHPASAVITGADTNLISTASLFGSLPQEEIDKKLTKLYPSLAIDLTTFKQEIRKLNKFSFQGLITSFDFSYTEEGSVDATISLTGTSNTYTDVSMLMNPETKKTDEKKATQYNTVTTSSVAELQAKGFETGSTEFYGLLYEKFENLRAKFISDNKLSGDPPLLISFNEKYTDQFMLYGELYPNIEKPKYPTKTFVKDTASSLTEPEQLDEFNKQEAENKSTFDAKYQTYANVQRYITLGALIDFINNTIIKKIVGSAETATIICNDSKQFSNYYPQLTSCIPKDILLLPSIENLDSTNGGMTKYGSLTLYPTILKSMATLGEQSWPGIFSSNSNDKLIYTSRIFINLEYIQTVLNTLSESNTKSFTLTSFLASISSRISYATGNAIILKLVTDPNMLNQLIFSDTKYLKSENTKEIVKPYSVPMLANHPNGTIVREFSFQAKLPSNVKNLSYVLNSGTNVSDDEIAPYLNFMYNSKDPAAINQARSKYKEKHIQIAKNLSEAKDSYGKTPFVPETTTSLYKALIEYIKYPFDDITKSQQLTAPIFPFDVEFTIDGINGLRYGDVLTFNGLPEKYKKNTVFSIIGITHDVTTEGVWTQKVKCIMRPQIG